MPVLYLGPILLLAGSAALPKAADATPTLPPPRIEMRIDAPDATGPWKMVVTNQGDATLRLAADGRLLRLEITAPEGSAAPQPKARKATPAKPRIVECKLPSDLRPAGIVEDRAVLLRPGARYEEVFSPALYCFGPKDSAAMQPGAQVVAKLGFAPPKSRPGRTARVTGPFVVEPTAAAPTVSPLTEIIAPSFALTVPSQLGAVGRPTPRAVTPRRRDHPAPRRAGDRRRFQSAQLELLAAARVDTPDERTVEITLIVKNVGGRPVTANIRRDNLVFDVDGPSGSTRCGQPAIERGVPREDFATLGPRVAQSFSVWVGEMCPNSVFDRPGLYTIRPSLTFPGADPAVHAFARTITTKEPILVRVRAGSSPYYASPPQVLGGPR